MYPTTLAILKSLGRVLRPDNLFRNGMILGNRSRTKAQPKNQIRHTTRSMRSENIDLCAPLVGAQRDSGRESSISRTPRPSRDDPLHLFMAITSPRSACAMPSLICSICTLQERLGITFLFVVRHCIPLDSVVTHAPDCSRRGRCSGPSRAFVFCPFRAYINYLRTVV